MRFIASAVVFSVFAAAERIKMHHRKLSYGDYMAQKAVLESRAQFMTGELSQEEPVIDRMNTQYFVEVGLGTPE